MVWFHINSWMNCIDAAATVPHKHKRIAKQKKHITKVDKTPAESIEILYKNLLWMSTKEDLDSSQLHLTMTSAGMEVQKKKFRNVISFSYRIMKWKMQQFTGKMRNRRAAALNFNKTTHLKNWTCQKKSIKEKNYAASGLILSLQQINKSTKIAITNCFVTV